VSTTVIVYCRTGAGSAKAAATLRRLGYLYVFDLGSYLNWGQGAPAPT
jgi:rhodanese-related sulfurtransferase